MDPAGKTALVTGGARRVGKAIATALARAGARVIITYQTAAEEAQATAAELKRSGGQALALPCDQRDLAAIARLFDRLRQETDQLEMIVNNAAIMERRPALEVTPDDWARVIETNLRGPFFIAQHAARWLQERGQPGVIVNIADLSAQRPWPSYVTHTISKAGLVAMTEALALAFAPSIRVNAVAPGLMLKPDDWPDERWQSLSAALPLARSGSAEEVAEAVLYCVRSDFMTGHTLIIDGGRTLK